MLGRICGALVNRMDGEKLGKGKVWMNEGKEKG